MKRNLSLLILLISCLAISGCRIFKGGCGCPKVAFIKSQQPQIDKKS